MINYIIQVTLFQIVFLIVYDLFLGKDTFFTKNRFYLITAVVVSFVLPFLKVSLFKEVVQTDVSLLLPEVILSPQRVIEKLAWYQNINYLEVVFWFGTMVCSITFIIKMVIIIRLIFKGEIQENKEYKLVLLSNKVRAFSFFNYIFLGKGISREKHIKIIQHELVHSKQKHSLDLLFFELLRIVMWFNPLIYIYQRRITLIHEFISDEVVAKEAGQVPYVNSLLSEVFQVEHISFINQFYKQSFIKKRIVMITKKKSKEVSSLKFLVIIPVLLGMLLYVSCSPEKEILEEKVTVKENLTEPILITEELSSVVNKNRPLSSKVIIEEVTEEVSEVQYISNIPFSKVDKVPTFPGCSDGDKTCFYKGISNFVRDNFNVETTKGLGLKSGKNKIYTMFTINTYGDVVNIKVRAPHPKLKEEVLMLVNKLPKFKPAVHKGKNVNVNYVLPITFNIQ